MVRALFRWILLASLLCLAGLARAQSDSRTGNEIYARATALIGQQKFPEALELLEDCYANVWKNPILLWEIARLHAELRHPAAGLKALEGYERDIDRPYRTQSPEDLAALKVRLKGLYGKLVIMAGDGDHAIRVNGKIVGRSPTATLAEVDPGVYGVDSDGTEGRSVTVVSGETAVVTLRPPPPPPVIKAEPPPPPIFNQTIHRGKWVLAGLGLAGLVVGGALGIYDGAQTCDNQPYCATVLDTRALSLSFLIGGGVVLGGALVLFGTDRPIVPTR